MPVRTRRRPPSQDSATPSGPGVASARPRAGSGAAQQSAATKQGKTARRKRRKDPVWARLAVIMGAVLMVTSGLAIVGSEAVISQVSNAIDQDDLLGEAGKTQAEGGKSLDGPIDLLLLGVDARARLSAEEVHADTIIVLHIPATHDQAYLISIPRDTEVQVPPSKKNGYPGGTAKATEAFFHGAQRGGGWSGGAQLLAKTINRLTGISFDGMAIIDFGGFKGVIDALGSIPMCVKHEVGSLHMTLVDGKPKWNADAAKLSGMKEKVFHKKGCRDMKGWEALDYARQRYGLPGGDYDRQQNQQQLIKAIGKKAMSDGVMANPVKLTRLLNAAGKAFILDTGGVDVADFVFTLRGVAANDMVLLRTNDGKFNSNESGRELLKPISHEMFAAVKKDLLGEFIMNNPAVLAPTK